MRPNHVSSRMDRRRFVAGAMIAGALVPTSLKAAGVQSLAESGGRLNILDGLPVGVRAAIRSGAVTADLAAYLDQAARRAVVDGRQLYFPAGTYTMRTWSPPAGLTVVTDGRATIFKQLSTRGKPQRFIEVGVDGVRLWPGGAATIDGGMSARADNATAFNSGVRVHARRGTRIGRFECGDIYGRDLGGDVLETGCEAGGFLGTCSIGTLYGDNVYRNILSITGGAVGAVAAVVQTGGCGFATVCLEPDPTSAPVGDWTIGSVIGNRVTISGDRAARVGSMTIGSLDLDHRRAPSRPEFAAGGVSRAATPTTFEVGLYYRNIAALRIDRATIANFPHAAIEDIGSRPVDPGSGQVSIGSLTIRNCGQPGGYQVVTQKTRLFEVGQLTAVEKSSPLIATFFGGQPMTALRVQGGQLSGRAVLAAEGDFEANNLAVRGMADRVFYNVKGRLKLAGLTVSDAAVLFDNCTGPIEMTNSSAQVAQVARGSATPRFRDSRINGRPVN